MSEEDQINDGTLEMPFGKHEGETIEAIPSSYLRWLCEKFGKHKDDDKYIQAAYVELQFREDNNTHF